MVPPRARDTAEPGPTRPTPGVRRSYLIAFAAALALYLLSMAPGVLWQDSGLAQVRVLRGDLRGDLGLALSHPLYYVLAFAFQYLPLVDSAFRTNLVSVIFGAVSVANVFLLVRLATGRIPGALIGVLALSVAHTFWQHCALAEVYTVSTALLSAELLCLLQYDRTGKERWLVTLFLANGLGISNHMLASLSLACYAVLVLWLLSARRARGRLVPLLAASWIAGAALYLGLIAGQITAGAGVGETLGSALFGAHYSANVLNVFPTARQLLHSAMYLALNFATPAVLLVISGLAALRTGKLRVFSAVLTGLLVVHLVWAVRYDVPDQYTFFIPSVVLLAVVIGMGSDRFLVLRSRRWVYALAATALLPPVAVYACLPTIARNAQVNLGAKRPVPHRDTYTYFLRPWKTGYRGAQRFARDLDDLLPGGAVLFADDTTVRPIHYLRLTRGWREDVRVYPPIERTTGRSIGFDEQDLSSELADGLVYVVSPRAGYCPQWLLNGYRFEREGIVYRVSGGK